MTRPRVEPEFSPGDLVEFAWRRPYMAEAVARGPDVLPTWVELLPGDLGIVVMVTKGPKPCVALMCPQNRVVRLSPRMLRITKKADD